MSEISPGHRPRPAGGLLRPGPRTGVLLGLLAVTAGCASLGFGQATDGESEAGTDTATADSVAAGDTAVASDTAAPEALQAAIDSAASLRDSVLAVLRARRAAGDTSAAAEDGDASAGGSGRAIAEEGPSGPVRVTDVDSLRALGPVYTPYDVPPLLREARLEDLLRATILPVIRRHGLEPDEWARFWVLVDREGRVVDHRVHLGSGHVAFDEAAAAAARALRYRPARRDDEPVPAWVLVRISLLMGRG